MPERGDGKLCVDAPFAESHRALTCVDIEHGGDAIGTVFKGAIQRRSAACFKRASADTARVVHKARRAVGEASVTLEVNIDLASGATFGAIIVPHINGQRARVTF